MAYDEKLVQRVRENLTGQPGLVEKLMFGGVGFLLHGNMACGVIKEKLIIRVGPDNYDEALAQPHTGVFDITGRPMRGWVMVSSGGYVSEVDLQAWVQRGVNFALSLPPK